jgi:hypothetical protein
MGYGGAALLTAYYFQCPNNTLPIIWADGENNRTNDHAYKWSPLFPYLPKKPISARNRERTPKEIATKPSKSTQVQSVTIRSTGDLNYRYRVGLLDIDLGLSNLSQLARGLNDWQNYFHFVAPRNVDLNPADRAVISFDGQKNLSVYQIDTTFFSQFDDLAVDVAGCFTRYPLAFADISAGTVQYNYYSGPSKYDRRFMFISANQLLSFCRSASCSLEQGLAYILTSQLIVYFAGVGYHEDTLECPMDFCGFRADMIKGLKVRRLCSSCTSNINNKELSRALQLLLDWSPVHDQTIFAG